MAFNKPLHEVLGDLDKIHPEVRRFAIGLLLESGIVDRPDRLPGMGRVLANVVVSLHIGRDCNEIDSTHWPEMSEYFRAIGDVMVEFGVKPDLRWPEHDRAASPAWADL